jgi:2-dehydro-3-deoxy-D-arabinonate dehydratase
MAVYRERDVAFSGTISTRTLRRSPAELVACLFAGQPYPEGAVLATGTGIVPEMDFTLRAGDVVDIVISEVGRLATPVVFAREWEHSLPG